MIEVVRFRNFKALQNVDVKLGRFTVLVGPNASGKTSVLDGLLFLVELARRPHFPQQLSRLHFGSSSTYSLEEAHSRKPDAGGMMLQFEGSWQQWGGGLSFRTTGGSYEVDASWGPATLGTHFARVWGLYHPNRDTSSLDPLRSRLPSIATLRADPARCAQASYSEALVPRVERDGYGVASVLADMLVSRSEDFDVLVEQLHRIVPSVRGVRAKRAQVFKEERQVITVNGQQIHQPETRSYWGHAVELDVAGADHVAAHLASEGTLVVLALLTALFGEPKPTLLLLDDLERALHPKAQAELIRCLRELLAARPDLQIVATSHSPYLLDHFAPEEVRLMSVDGEGNASCASLDEHPDFERWKGVMTAGEFWSSVGEGWVKDVAKAKHDAGGALPSRCVRCEG